MMLCAHFTIAAHMGHASRALGRPFSPLSIGQIAALQSVLHKKSNLFPKDGKLFPAILIAAALAASIIVNAIAVALSRMQREA